MVELWHQFAFFIKRIFSAKMIHLDSFQGKACAHSQARNVYKGCGKKKQKNLVLKSNIETAKNVDYITVKAALSVVPTLFLKKALFYVKYGF